MILGLIYGILELQIRVLVSFNDTCLWQPAYVSLIIYIPYASLSHNLHPRKIGNFSEIVYLNSTSSDIVDIKPANMEELTEVITAAEFHPVECNIFAYSSSKGTVRLCDMRKAALCDRHSKCKLQ